jgi:predicted transcriptional regulator
MAASTTMTIRVSPEVKEKLAKLAQVTRRSSSFLAAEAIEAYLAQELPIVESILQSMADVEAGNFLTHDEVVAQMNAIIDAASRRVA